LSFELPQLRVLDPERKADKLSTRKAHRETVGERSRCILGGFAEAELEVASMFEVTAPDFRQLSRREQDAKLRKPVGSELDGLLYRERASSLSG
jgi:hypothetical protein